MDADFIGRFHEVPKIIEAWTKDYCDLGSARILEFGCRRGPAALGLAIAVNPLRIVGVGSEFTRSMLKRKAKQHLDIHSLPECLELFGDLSDAAIASSGPFDLAFSWSALDALAPEEISRTAKTIWDSLADDGLFLLQVDSLYHSASGANLDQYGVGRWEHLTQPISELAAHVFGNQAATPEQTNNPVEHDEAGDYARKAEQWQYFLSRNRFTANDYIQAFKSVGFGLLKQYRGIEPNPPPTRLLALHDERTLTTKQLVALYRKHRGGRFRDRTAPRSSILAGCHELSLKKLEPWHRLLDSRARIEEPNRPFPQSPIVGWCIENLTGIEGLEVLEVGPWEGYYTMELELSGASRVVSVENSWLNYLKCLQVKNMFGLGAEFIHADAEATIGELDGFFDLIFLAGVLYHLVNPIEFLEKCASRTDQIYIWSHYFDADLVSKNTAERPFGNILSDMFVDVRSVDFGDREYRYHVFRYEDEFWSKEDFAGGANRTACWMELPQLLQVIDSLGFEVVAEAKGEITAGPFVQLALRRAPKASN